MFVKLRLLIAPVRLKLGFLSTVGRALLHSDGWKTLARCDVLFVRHDADCGYTYQARAYAQLSDSVGDLFRKHGISSATIATPYSLFTGGRTYGTVASYNREALRIAVAGRAMRILLGRERGIAWANERRTRLWTRILQTCKPRRVIAIMPDVCLCRAGKKSAVPVSDLQHGAIAEGHPWYGRQFRLGVPSRDLPDEFLCWDEQSAAVLRTWAPEKGIVIRIIGNPWFKRFLERDPRDVLVGAAIAEAKVFDNSRPVILHSLSWRMDDFYKHPDFNKVMVDSLERAIKATADQYNWLLRMHPVQLYGRERGNALKYLRGTFGHLAGVDWERCSRMPLPVVLAQCDLHITDLSSTVIEAAWLGIRSALLNEQLRPNASLAELYAYERSLGVADLVPQDARAIEEWIRVQLARGRGKALLSDASRGFDALVAELTAPTAIVPTTAEVA